MSEPTHEQIKAAAAVLNRLVSIRSAVCWDSVAKEAIMAAIAAHPLPDGHK